MERSKNAPLQLMCRVSIGSGLPKATITSERIRALRICCSFAGTGEAAAPETTQVERQNHPIHAVNHSLVAPLELAQLAATAYCTSGKQADHLTRAQQFVDPVQRIPAVTAGDGNDAKQIQKPLQIPALVDPRCMTKRTGRGRRSGSSPSRAS